MRLGRDPARDAVVRMSFGQQPGTAADRWDVGQVTIDVLPDVALLEIFDCHVNQLREVNDYSLEIQAWHTLVHVCRKWRSVVFGSPCRLNLRLLCAEKTPVREMLAIWSPLPLIVWKTVRQNPWGLVNIVASLHHNDRVFEISLLDVSTVGLAAVLAPNQPANPALS